MTNAFHSPSLSSLSLSSVTHISSNSLNIRRKFIHSTSSLMKRNSKNNNKNVIDVEYYDANENENKKNNKNNYKPTRSNNNDNNNNDDDSIINKAFTGIKRFFKQDEESLNKKEKQKQIDNLLDNAFKNTPLATGLLGMVTKTMVKGLGSLVIDTIQNSQQQQNEIFLQIENIIRNDKIASREVGTTPDIGSPLSSSSSSNINGNIKNQMSLIVPIIGINNTTWQASVTASSSGSSSSSSCEIVVDSLTLMSADGRRIAVVAKGRGGGRVIDV